MRVRPILGALAGLGVVVLGGCSHPQAESVYAAALVPEMPPEAWFGMALTAANIAISFGGRKQRLATVEARANDAHERIDEHLQNHLEGIA